MTIQVRHLTTGILSRRGFTSHCALHEQGHAHAAQPAIAGIVVIAYTPMLLDGERRDSLAEQWESLNIAFIIVILYQRGEARRRQGSAGDSGMNFNYLRGRALPSNGGTCNVGSIGDFHAHGPRRNSRSRT
jgi:hypothetical protein